MNGEGMSEMKSNGNERFLLLVRHAIAEDRSGEKGDFDRRLTKEGEARFKAAAKGIATIFPSAAAIISSPYVRCMQTALLLARALETNIEVASSELLTPQSTADDFMTLVESLEDDLVIVVGHEPSLSRGMMRLAGVSGSFELKKGGLYGVRLEGTTRGVLEWMIPPRVLRRV